MMVFILGKITLLEMNLLTQFLVAGTLFFNLMEALVGSCIIATDL